MSLGTITYMGREFPIEVFQTSTGYVPDIAEAVTEELVAPGVDGRRFRLITNQTRQFQARTLHSVVSHAAGVDLCREFQRLRGKRVSLSIVIDNVGYTYTSEDAGVFVIDCTPSVLPGGLTGANLFAPTGTHHVSAAWDLALMQTPSAGSNP
jgi:hypothetical protein